MSIQNYNLSLIIVPDKPFTNWSELLPRVHSALEALNISCTRAYDALMPPQRYRQRQRHKIITTLIEESGQKKRVMDVGCGSSRIIGALPPGSLILDILLHKLRYAR